MVFEILGIYDLVGPGHVFGSTFESGISHFKHLFINCSLTLCPLGNFACLFFVIC